MSAKFQIIFICIIVLCVIFGVTKLLNESGKDATLGYAKQFNLTPTGEVKTHFSLFGSPFLHCPNGSFIYSIPTKSGVLYVRTSLSLTL
jgi:hypothetical protein